MNLLPPQTLNPNQPGVLVQKEDWNANTIFMQATAGYAVAFSQGVTNGDAIPQFQALNCTPAGGMVISLGGSSGNPQVALVAGVISWAPAAQNFTVPNNGSGQTRIDIVCVQSQQTQGSTVSRPIEGDGNQNVPYDYSGIAYQYVEGTPGSGQPSAPSGWETFAVITVPSGASSITSGDIAIAFPVMNPTGPQGPQGVPGHGTTTLTADVSIPNVGQTVNMHLADVTAFQVGVNGLASDNVHAMYFVVTAVAGSVATVMNLGAPDGLSNSGTIGHPGLVGFGNAPGTTFTTAQITGWTAGAALSWTVNSVDEWNLKMFGVVFGPNNAPGAFIFQVENIVGNTLYGNVVSVIAGNPASPIAVGAYVFPIAPPLIAYQDGTDVTNNGMIRLSGKTPNIGIGDSYTVSFSPVQFLSTETWRFLGLTPIPLGTNGFTPQISAKTETGFTVFIPGTATDHGPIEWAVEGQLYIV